MDKKQAIPREIGTGGSKQGKHPEAPLEAPQLQQPDQTALAKREKSQLYRQWVAKNRERRRASQKVWYQKHRERERAKHRTYYQAHQEQERGRSRKYYQAHHAPVRARQQRYYKRQVAAKMRLLPDGL